MRNTKVISNNNNVWFILLIAYIFKIENEALEEMQAEKMRAILLKGDL